MWKDVKVIGPKHARLNHGSRSGGNSAYVFVKFVWFMIAVSWSTKSIQCRKSLDSERGKAPSSFQGPAASRCGLVCIVLDCPPRCTPLLFFIYPGAYQAQYHQETALIDSIPLQSLTGFNVGSFLSRPDILCRPTASHPLLSLLSLVSGADSIQTRGAENHPSGIPSSAVVFLSTLELRCLAIKTSCVLSDVLTRASTCMKS